LVPTNGRSRPARPPPTQSVALGVMRWKFSVYHLVHVSGPLYVRAHSPISPSRFLSACSDVLFRFGFERRKKCGSTRFRKKRGRARQFPLDGLAHPPAPTTLPFIWRTHGSVVSRPTTLLHHAGLYIPARSLLITYRYCIYSPLAEKADAAHQFPLISGLTREYFGAPRFRSGLLPAFTRTLSPYFPSFLFSRVREPGWCLYMLRKTIRCSPATLEVESSPSGGAPPGVGGRLLSPTGVRTAPFTGHPV